VALCGSVWLQLEEQEALLREDVTDEVARYSGQLMLHKEVDARVRGRSDAFEPERAMRVRAMHS